MALYISKKGLFLTVLVTAAAAVGVACKLNLFPSSPAGAPAQDNGQQVSTPSPKNDANVTSISAGPTGFTEPEILEYLHRLPAAERMTWLAKVLNKDRDFKPVARDTVRLHISEQGAIVTDSLTDVTALVGGTIREIIADGVMVKKGDKLLEIDDKARKELLQKKNVLIAQYDQAHRLAAEALGKLRTETQSVVREAEVEWKLAELARKRYKGDDAEQKKKLQLEVQQTQQALEQARSQATLRESKLQADIQTKKASLEQVLTEHLVLEGEIARCVLVAPRPGLVIYHLPPPEKDGEPIIPSLRPGETVNDGQLVMRICDDLDCPLLLVNIDAAHAGQVRAGQKAFVERVAGLPNRVFAAKVKSVGAPVKGPGSRGQVLPTKLELHGNLGDLRPLMAGSALIVVDERLNCLRLPLPSVRAHGKDKLCFVLSGNDLQERKLSTGLANNQYVEIVTGLEEGEMVLNLQSIIRRQAEYLKYK